MAFSEKVKLEVKRKSAFRCVVCGKPFVEIHHIIPQKDGGKDILDNAAPLCAYCHDLYGGNPEKRKQIKQMRDYWFQRVEKSGATIDKLLYIHEQDNDKITLFSNRNVAIYHVIFSYEKFEEAAQMIFELIKGAQKNSPNANRILYLDIDGHKNKSGGFDGDMFELQKDFILGFLMQYLYEVHMPICSVRNPKRQINEIPDVVKIFDDAVEMNKFIK
jgi:Restriction endonuclease